MQERLSMIDQGFHLKCPPDFLLFYEFCKSLSLDTPLDALSDINFRLVGPFEILHLGSKEPVKKGQWSNYYRFYHDPPEFVTLIMCTDESYHIGYFRDSYESESFLAKSTHSSNGVFEYCGENLFACLRSILQGNKCKQANHLSKCLIEFASSKNISTDLSPTYMKNRKKRQVCATTNCIGLMIDVTKNDIGYRPLNISYTALNNKLEDIVNEKSKDKQLIKFAPIDELITCVQFANDEGDFGQGLELGLSLLAFHPKAQPLEAANIFNNKIKHLLSVGYTLANRKEFSQVVQLHMDDRRIKPLTFTLNRNIRTNALDAKLNKLPSSQRMQAAQICTLKKQTLRIKLNLSKAIRIFNESACVAKEQCSEGWSTALAHNDKSSRGHTAVVMANGRIEWYWSMEINEEQSSLNM
ncbi:Histone PARylation factor 1 [Schistosoma japonicum]|nr:Histone PARylation factor 1 [Schistosoma japonicum]